MALPSHQELETMIEIVMQRLGKTREQAKAWVVRYLREVGDKWSIPQLKALVERQKAKRAAPSSTRPRFTPTYETPSPDDDGPSFG